MITGTYTYGSAYGSAYGVGRMVAVAGGPAPIPNIVAGFALASDQPKSYREIVQACRWYYQNDPHMSTVIQRIADLAASGLVNTDVALFGGDTPDSTTYDVFNAVAERINDIMHAVIIGYLVDGMAIPQYELQRVMGTRLPNVRTRTRYVVPASFWLRDPLQFDFYPPVFGAQPMAYLRIPSEDIAFVESKGTFPDGRRDPARYRELVERFPDYVAAIRRGETALPYNGYIIYRNLLPQATYPQPFLQPVLGALARKYMLQRLDTAISSRMIEAFRHAKVGNDAFPADDSDIEALKAELEKASNENAVFNIVTNHTVEISWILPDYKGLLDPAKYDTVHRDILVGLGFPRILLVGETERSNSADNQFAALGFLALVRHIQRDMIQWVYHVYRDVAGANGFTRVPKPEFLPVRVADTNQLLQYAETMFNIGVISRATVAGLYGVDYRSERLRREQEDAQLLDVSSEQRSEQRSEQSNEQQTNAPNDAADSADADAP